MCPCFRLRAETSELKLVRSFTAKVRESLVHLRGWTIKGCKVTVEFTMPNSDYSTMYVIDLYRLMIYSILLTYYDMIRD